MSQTGLDVRGLEERAFNAWPALQTVLAEGWVFRFADGYTKRANSINALAPTVDVEAAVAMARPYYAALELPVIVRVSPLAPGDPDARLAALGFEHLDETRVMTMALGDGFRRDPDVVMESQPTEDWADGFARANAVPARHRQTHDRMLASIRPAAAFANLRVPASGETVAWGLAVVERGVVGLFDIVTAPAARRQGVGRRLVQSLLTWGAEQGAHAAYLQVVAGNTPAIHLYEDLGFRESYRYHYRRLAA